MKLALVSIFSLVFLYACIPSMPKSTKSSEKMDFGTVEGRKYSNTYFDFDLTFGENWIIDTTKKYKSSFAPHLLEADYYKDENRDLPQISCNILGDKIMPFGLQTIEKYFDESYEALKLIYNAEELERKTLEDITIGGKKFKLGRIVLNDPELTLIVDEYAMIHKDYVLSITLTYSDTSYFPKTQEVLKSIHFK